LSICCNEHEIRLLNETQNVSILNGDIAYKKDKAISIEEMNQAIAKQFKKDFSSKH